MVSDSCDTPMCKKCGGKLTYLDHEHARSDKILHDHMWSSNGASSDDIDPDYVPK
jgi:hypothetical protein